ncbi:hypothetical protein PF008_g32300, partial [Phytophthora fragariae]
RPNDLSTKTQQVAEQVLHCR